MEDESASIINIHTFEEKDEFFSDFFPEFFQVDRNNINSQPVRDEIGRIIPENLYYKAEGKLTNTEIDNKSLKSLDEEQLPFSTSGIKSHYNDTFQNFKSKHNDNNKNNSFNENVLKTNLSCLKKKINPETIIIPPDNNDMKVISPIINPLLPKSQNNNNKAPFKYSLFNTKTQNNSLISTQKNMNSGISILTSTKTSKNSNNVPNVDEIKEKELKLLKNRLSARKCRQKKKNYIIQLEKQVELYKEQIDNYQNEYNKDKSIEHYLTILDEKEKEIENTSNKKKVENITSEYITNQKILLNNLFINQIKVMMPIDCKIFQNKFIKLAQFEKDESIDNILNKIDNNIKMLNELYDFKKRVNLSINGNNSLKGKEQTAYKLFLFYENIKTYVEIFLSNLNLI